MMKLIFATHNANKLAEVKKMIPPSIELLGLTDINCHHEIVEDGATLEQNARIKSDFVRNHYGLNCFSDDTGLEIEALDGAPGVLSARYAGAQKNSTDNINKVLDNMKGMRNRKAQFRTVISLWIGDKEMSFEGIVSGEITTEISGQSGFGYDSIFIPEGYDKTFAELSASQKNEISHRGIAMKKLMSYLQNY